MVEVVAALIWNGAHDEILICQRAANKARGSMWEFVGGKVERGETKEAALIRECQEELGITLAIERWVMDVAHTYPDITVNLTLLWQQSSTVCHSYLSIRPCNGCDQANLLNMIFVRQMPR